MTLKELDMYDTSKYKKHDSYPEGEDLTDTFSQVTGDELDEIGITSLSGYIKIKPIDLILTFGKPTASDGYKSSGTYTFKHESGKYLVLYDWKLTTLIYDDCMNPIDFWKQDKEIQFNVGASTGNYTQDLEDWLKLMINRNTLKINRKGY